MPISSRFLTLPAEVRLLIYAHVFAGAVLRPRYQLRLRSASPPPPAIKTTAILATCHLCQVEALPVFFRTCQFKLTSSVDKHAFLSSVPASAYASVQYLILDATKLLFDWTPRLIARNFPSLKRLEVPHSSFMNRNSGFTKVMAEDPSSCAAIVQDGLSAYAKVVAGARRHQRDLDVILSHTREEGRSYAFVLRTMLSFSFSLPRETRFVVSMLFKEGCA
jgi:hypothetical protein